MSYGTCEKCLRGFHREPDQHWKRLCVECWKQSKRQPTYTSSGNRNSSIEARLRIELEGLRLRAVMAESRLFNHTCQTSALDLETLKRIRLLVHPDKHGNSHAANEISQRINQMIREVS